jgi:hypothetical protein
VSLRKKAVAEFFERSGWCLAGADRQCWLLRFPIWVFDLSVWRWRLA